jgi:hypothetical protein
MLSQTAEPSGFSWCHTHMRRVWLGGLLFCHCLATQSQAGPIKTRQLKETVQAPILAVGRVVTVEKDKAAVTPWPGCATAAVAEIEVLRAFGLPGFTKPGPGMRLRVAFYTDGRCINPPMLPAYQLGRVYVFALKEHLASDGDLFRLIADEGFGIVIEARAEPPGGSPPVRDGREFVLREIANALSLGTPVEVFGAAEYLISQSEDFTAELMPLLEARVGTSQPRWAEVATNLLSAMGMHRGTASDLISGRLTTREPARGWPDEGLSLTQAVLHKLPASAATDRLIIRTLLNDAPVHPAGSAVTLLEYKDNPVLIEGLRGSLNRGIEGSSYIAWALIRSGQKAFLSEALARALKVADRPKGDRLDLTGAALLLLDYGSDAQLDELARLVRKYRKLDPSYFHVLWQSSSGAGKPREARVLAVLITDKTLIPRSRLRYCDIAVLYLEQATKEHFGAEGETLAERDEAVVRAIAWLDAHGIPH